jgi:CheY-like chemotaxis protein
VVEDNEMNLVYLQTVLSAQGYRVIAAADGREALETLSRQAVDAALIDLQIPGLNGFDLARRVRTGQAGGRKDLPLLAVTGFALEETRARCLEEGFQGFITKPINEKGLLRAVREALQASPPPITGPQAAGASR